MDVSNCSSVDNSDTRSNSNSPRDELGDTPRSRETSEEFARRMCGVDALEGPSWLFADVHVDHSQTSSSLSQTCKSKGKGRKSMAATNEQQQPVNKKEEASKPKKNSAEDR